MNRLLLSSVFVAAFAARADAAPPWCAPVEGKLMHAALTDALTSSDPRDAVPAIVAAICHAKPGSEEAQRAREVEAARLRVMKRLDMTEADWTDAGAWAAEHRGKLMSTTGLDVDAKKPWSALTPIDQFVAISRAEDDASYLADALGAKLTEVGRLAYILDCLRVRRGVVDWAICQSDIEQLDRKKLAAQLRGAGTAYERMALRLDLHELDDKLAAHAKNVKDALAKDSAYQAVFATAAAGRTAFGKADPKLVALVTAMDDARVSNSRKASAGCGATTWPALQRAIASIPANQFALVEAERRHERVAGAITNNMNGYLAALAYVSCSENSGAFAHWLGDAMARWPGFRGPRSTALTTIMNAGIELDDRDARLEFPSSTRGWIASRSSTGGGGRGKVAKVEKRGATAVVSFTPKLETGTACTGTRRTNRIVQIRSDGSLVYESHCTGYKKVTYDTASKPQTVDSRHLGGLKPGVHADIIDDVVLYVFPKGQATTPSHVAGVEVK